MMKKGGKEGEDARKGGRNRTGALAREPARGNGPLRDFGGPFMGGGVTGEHRTTPSGRTTRAFSEEHKELKTFGRGGGECFRSATRFESHLRKSKEEKNG